ncbi:polysaccharide deacetylase family protein [Allokutzneria multivorans]|uniref:Polysaccharide deacetylase family protein n=1 Tax=Allokutzneria multivorans TaxID=1142134 RepID=A0ABP7TJ84_9PSEU
MRLLSSRRVLVASVLALAFIAACGAPPPPPPAPAPPPPPPTPTGPPVPSFDAPYAFGTSQAKIPPLEHGLAPVVKRVHTDKPYVFITIDDGQVPHPAALDLMRRSKTHPTLFLTDRYVEGHRGYFKDLRDQAGATIENHTLSHPNLRGKPYDVQHKEICGTSDAYQREYGKRPVLFRPPYGNYDDTTRKAAADCGIKALVLWTETVNDGVVQFQAGTKLKAGDIVLMHFRKTFVEDYTALLAKIKEDGMTPVPLADFLTP